jgi:hypothetical protein
MKNPQTFLQAGWDFTDETTNGILDVWIMPLDGEEPQLAWVSGEKIAPVLEGQGTRDNPYEIYTASDLCAMTYDRTACYVLMQDIDLSEFTWNNAPVVDFGGYFNGNGFGISNLHVQGNACLGLFGKVAVQASVKDLSVLDVNIVGGDDSVDIGAVAGINFGTLLNCDMSGQLSAGEWSSSIGGLVGVNVGGIDHCQAQSQIAVAGYCYYVGGLVGMNGLDIVADSFMTRSCADTAIYAGHNSWSIGGLLGSNVGVVGHCRSEGTIQCEKYCQKVGGLLGNNSEYVRDCFAGTEISGGSKLTSLGGLVGQNLETIEHCFSTGYVSDGTNAGGLIGRNAGRVLGSFWNKTSSQRTTSSGGTGLTSYEMKNRQTFLQQAWDFADEFPNGVTDCWVLKNGEPQPSLAFLREDYVAPTLEGDGSPNNPYQIKTANDLGAIAHLGWSCDYILKGDIDLSQMNWTVPPILYFNGRFDGSGFRVHHLTLQGSRYLGLTGVLGKDAVVTDLSVIDVNIAGTDGSWCIGGLAGYLLGVIEDCHASGNIVTGIESENVGGLVGQAWAYSAIKSSSTSGSVAMGDQGQYLGGLVGRNSAEILRCFATNTVTGGQDTYLLGGLVGWNMCNDLYFKCRLFESHATGQVQGGNNSKGIGGLVGGVGWSSIDRCYATGNVSGHERIGGFVGWNAENVSNCYAAGDVSGYSIIGGFVGWNDEKIVNCYATGLITGDEFVGGFDAWNWGTVRQCFWDIENSGSIASMSAHGLSTAEMKASQTFLNAGWDFTDEATNGLDDFWTMVEYEYPQLSWTK